MGELVELKGRETDKQEWEKIKPCDHEQWMLIIPHSTEPLFYAPPVIGRFSGAVTDTLQNHEDPLEYSRYCAFNSLYGLHISTTPGIVLVSHLPRTDFTRKDWNKIRKYFEAPMKPKKAHPLQAEYFDLSGRREHLLIAPKEIHLGEQQIRKGLQKYFT